MKLTYVKLKNFALLRAGMGIDEIELDFTKAKNTLTIIIGNNGTGKTGLLSNLHPFASLGHLEARDDQDLIIPGLDGEKRCNYETKNHTYEIRHVYKWQGEGKSRKISSYIKKDGNELNSPGTVTSFIDIVIHEFDIDINYLKLIRLGGNVQNFVELSSTERIQFIGKLLSSVDKFSKVNKRMRERSNTLTNVLKNSANKKMTLGITSVEVAKKIIASDEKSVSYSEEEMRHCTYMIGKIESKFNKEELEKAHKEVAECESEIEALKESLSSWDCNRVVFDPAGKLEVAMKRYNEKKEEQASLRANIATLLERFNGMEKDIRRIDDAAEGAISSVWVKDLEAKIKGLEETVNEWDESLDKVVKEYPYDDFKSDIDKVNMIYFHFDNIRNICYSKARFYLGTTWSKFHGDMKQVEDKIKSEHAKIADIMKSKRFSNIKEILTESVSGVLMLNPSCHISNKCAYYQTMNNIIGLQKKYDESIDDAGDFEMLSEAVKALPDLYAISKLYNMFTDAGKKNFYVSISNIKDAIIYDAKYRIIDSDNVTMFKEIYEDYDAHLDAVRSLALAKEEYQVVQKAGTSKEEYERMKYDLVIKQHNVSDEITKLQEQLVDVTKSLTEIEKIMEDCKYTLEYHQRKATIDSRCRELTVKIDSHKNLLESESKQLEELEYYKKEAEEHKERIKSKRDKINHLTVSIKIWESLDEEMDYIQKRLDYINKIKDATSQKEGIPLVYVKLYCRALCTIANDIIKNIYGGDFHLKKFDIDDGKFDIPYVTKGFNVKDIRNASQAEASVAKLAISFAILSQFMTKYNIPLLDEVDGPMHQVNKEKFFASIEGILKDTLKCEQAFLITQSVMFNEFPVNFIVTDSEYSHMLPKNACVIFQR